MDKAFVSINVEKYVDYKISFVICKAEILRVAMSHAQMSRIDCRVLAHGQAHSCEDAYDECRDNEQAKPMSVAMAIHLLNESCCSVKLNFLPYLFSSIACGFSIRISNIAPHSLHPIAINVE